jgi:hypothetical protein
MEETSHQFVDCEVTRRKYAQELSKFLSAREHYRKLGVILLEEAYPNMYFGFAAPSLVPLAIIFAVKINFDNYDVDPLSVRFVHPLTFEPVKASQLQTRLPRKLENSPLLQPLLQADKDEEPFICIPGVREYHKHTVHTGDSWFLYRQKGGEGSLCFILDNLQLYGTSHIRAYHLPIQIKTAQGLVQQPVRKQAVNISSDINSIPY